MRQKRHEGFHEAYSRLEEQEKYEILFKVERRRCPV